MEVGRRDIRFCSEEEEDKHHPSSSSSDTGVRWGIAPPDAGGGSGSGSGGGLPTTAAPLPSAFVEKEHMFDKVVTPSDVGKLNRLVIPKQHAERYFPLDSSSNEKGLLLSFEDRTGKPWRFRYSYWNSSQSYVMTKGWSRFVKEKRLDAGDTVSFGRGVGEADRDRLFIDWKRRPETAAINPSRLPRLPLPAVAGDGRHHHHHHPNPLLSFTGRSPPAATWGNSSFCMDPSVALYSHGHQHHPYNYHNAATTSGVDSRLLYFQQAMGLPSARVQPATAVEDLMVLDSLPPASRGTAKRVRLFGVNLDCGEPDIVEEDDVSTVHSLQLRLGTVGSTSQAEEEQSPLDLETSWDDRDRRC